MILAVDVGNTRIKMAVYEQDTLLEGFACSDFEFIEKGRNIFSSYPLIQSAIVSSVARFDTEHLNWLQKRTKVHLVTHTDVFPFLNKYSTPTTLGVDRMVLAAGAVLQFPNKNRLVIDVGTCVTYDFIDQENVYHGGAISPGFRLRYEALHNYTAKLPLLSLEEVSGIIGNSTKTAIHLGVINGLVFEMDGYISNLNKQNKNFIIILTGGDGNFLAKRLKNTIFANSNFLLDSLNQLYLYQRNHV